MIGMVTQSDINLCAMPNAKMQTNSIAQETHVLKHRKVIQGRVFRPYVHLEGRQTPSEVILPAHH